LVDEAAETAVREQSNMERERDTRLARALGRARWSILWERLWPALATIATTVGFFLVLSWLGVWL
jgi:hypothetical protein